MRTGTARWWVLGLAVTWAGLLGACKDPGKASLEGAKGHVAGLVTAAQQDVEDIRKGLPEGAKQLATLWKEPPATSAAPETPKPAAEEVPDAGPRDAAVADAGQFDAAGVPPSEPSSAPADAGSGSSAGDAGAETAAVVDAGQPAADAADVVEAAAAPATTPPTPDPASIRGALERAREKVQALRVAKSTFFAVTDLRGIVLRNDQDQDLMVGRGMLPAFPELKQALTGKYVETLGSMEEAATIKNRPDAQWIAASPILLADKPRGLYVTGWGWSAYARRLQLAVVSEVQDQLQPGQNEPLVYVVVVVGDHSYGWDVPDVTLNYVNDLKLARKVEGASVYGEITEITNRKWGIAAVQLPAFTGAKVIGVVARSET